MAAKQLPSAGWPDGQRPTAGPALPESLGVGGQSDSAGFPWQGRTFQHHDTAFAGDDGTTPVTVEIAVARVRAAGEMFADVASPENRRHLAEAHARAIASFATERFLVPLIAEAGELGTIPGGRTVEKTQELSIVTVAAPDGRRVLPIFTSVETMQRWHPEARPIPVPGAQAALAAAQEHTDLIMIDAATPAREYGVRRTALKAMALGAQVMPGWADVGVVAAFESSVIGEVSVFAIALEPGDPIARLAVPETRVVLTLAPGLNQSELDAILQRLQQIWAENERIAERIDSLTVSLRSADHS
jgi:hypothetical protein